MAQSPPPRVPMHGAVDLSGLKARASRPEPPRGPAQQDGSALGVGPAVQSAPAPDGSHGPNPYVVEVNEANFATEVMATSMQVPVVVDFWAGWCQPCKQLGPILEALAAEYEGRFVLATVDTDANQRLASEIGIQSLPTVLAVVGQQPVPLFTGALPEAQVREFLDDLLRVAAENGISGRVAPRGAAPAADAGPAEEAIPHREAYEALVRGDLDSARAGYAAALATAPADVDAAEGLARVELLIRVQGTEDPDAVLDAAQAVPTDVAAQLLAADIEVASGMPEQAFARLVQLVRISAGDDKDAAREHLLSLFLVLGMDDPRVGPARRALAGALF